MSKNVFNVVQAMNWSFGRGDLLRLEWSSLSGGYAVVKPLHCREERNTFRVEVADNGNAYVHYRSRRRLYRPAA